MNQQLIYFPCLFMLILSGIVLIVMFLSRVSAVKNGLVKVGYFKTYDMDVEAPRAMTQASRNFTNLFEVPTLFYMVCAFGLITLHIDAAFYFAAWLYVGLRCLHSVVHLTSNKIGPRMSVYGLSWIVLVYMGLSLGYKILQTI